MARHKNLNWNLPDLASGTFSGPTTEHAALAVLMDIRDELQGLKCVLNDIRDNTGVTKQRLNCTDTMAIPRILKRISHNTAKPRKKRK